MKFTVAIALCCAAQVFGLGLPNYLLPQTNFYTLPPYTFTSQTSIGTIDGAAGFTFVVPPSFSSTNRQYRRVFDDQHEVEYIPINNYVLLSNADLSGVAPRAKVLAVGPNVTRVSERHIGATVAHPALTTDVFNTNAGISFDQYAVAPGECYAWTGASLDWNMFVYSSYERVFDAHWLSTLDNADQTTGGTPTLFTPDDRVVSVYDPTVPLVTAQNYYPQTWIRSSAQSDGLYFCQDDALLGEVSVQSGNQRLFAKDRKTHIAYGGFRPNHVIDSPCDRPIRLLPGDQPSFVGPCPQFAT
jgi:hypothetical protein